TTNISRPRAAPATKSRRGSALHREGVAQPEAARQLVARPKLSNDRRLGRIPDQSLVSSVSEQAPTRVELIRNAARGGDTVNAPARPIGRQTRSERGRRADPEIGPLIARVGEQNPRSDREHITVAIAPDFIRADGADEPLVAAKALQGFGPKVERVAHLVTGARDRLDGRRNLFHGHVEIRMLATAFDVRRGTDREPARGNKRDSEAVIRRAELERVGAAGDVDSPQRRDFGA